MRLALPAVCRKSPPVAVLVLLAFPLSGTAAGTGVELRISWASGGESDLRGYRLRYRTAPGDWSEAIDTGQATTWTVKGLSLDTTYSFAVSAYDHADNESGPSAEVVARVPSSLAPIPQVLGVLDTASNSIYAPRSRQQLMRFTGRNFQAGAVISLGPDITINQPLTGDDGDLLAVVRVGGNAALGDRVTTIVNPDQGTGSASGLVQVVRTPDGNGDCAVDILDLNALARAWSEARGESRYVVESDLDGDDFVGPHDLTIFVKFMALSPWGCP